MISEDETPVETDRIYLSGWSNGCGMTQMLAVQASEVSAAAGCMSFSLIAPSSPNYTPIPLKEVHGLLDDLIVYGNAGGLYVFNQQDDWSKQLVLSGIS